MPINKDALKRYKIIDGLLADPNNDYTTDKIMWAVNRECEKVTKRMIQKDIKNIEEYFEKELIRNAAGRGTVKYADQTTPLFYKELTTDEEDVLREVLKSLGQFDGLDNFTWLDLLKKKLDFTSTREQPYISFSKNEGLQIPNCLLGRLFTAISRKKVIKVNYTKFGDISREHIVYPYQLKQYNDRWFLLCTPVESKSFKYNPEFIMNLALDRLDDKIEYMDEMEYLETPVNLQERFDEIIGITLDTRKEIEDITFAVCESSLPYIQTKWLHITQIKFDAETQENYRRQYPALSSYTFFSIECRENDELYSRFSSYAGRVVLVEPQYMREELESRLKKAVNMYKEL